jgi:hypothetical protein
MPMVRIRHVEPLDGYRLRLSLTDGRVIEKDVLPLFVGPAFDRVRTDPRLFAQAGVVHGTVAWPRDVDLDPDVLIWGGPPPNPSVPFPSGPGNRIGRSFAHRTRAAKASHSLSALEQTMTCSVC